MLQLSTAENEINVEDDIRKEETNYVALKSSCQPYSTLPIIEKQINVKDNIENLEINPAILETNALPCISSTSPAANTRAKVVSYKEL